MACNAWIIEWYNNGACLLCKRALVWRVLCACSICGNYDVKEEDIIVFNRVWIGVLYNRSVLFI